MKILALDSSGLVASVAVVTEEKTIAEYSVNYKKTHSQTLLPMLDVIAGMIDLDLTTIDAIAVAAGPGSFTGLRIGSATAKGLGLALDKPLVAVPTLEGLAYNACGRPGLICPIMDARRGQVFQALYRFRENEIETVTEQTTIDMLELIESLNRRGEQVFFLGDGVSAHREKIEQNMTAPYTLAPPNMNSQRAASVGTLALKYYAAGKTQTAAEHTPVYLRLSQAERERAEREKAFREKEKQEEREKAARAGARE